MCINIGGSIGWLFYCQVNVRDDKKIKKRDILGVAGEWARDVGSMPAPFVGEK